MADALPYWWNGVASIFANAGVPTHVWAPILIAESGGDPKAWNMGTPQNPEDSGGLFQLNRRGGQGAGYTREQLQDPYINAEIAARYIGPAFARYGDNIALVSVNSGHPGLVPLNDHRVRNIATIAAAFKKAGSGLSGWVAGLRINGNPSGETPGGEPGEGAGGGSGGEWGWPSPSSLGSGLVDGVVQGTMKLFGFPDPRDAGWAFVFTGAGVTLITVGLVGLAVSSKPGQAAVQAGVAAGTSAVGGAVAGRVAGLAAGRAAAAANAGPVDIRTVRSSARRAFNAVDRGDGTFAVNGDRAQALGILPGAGAP